MKVLIIASNSRRDLSLDREIRELKEVIEKSQNREEFEVIDELAVRVKDLQSLLYKHRPQIVHFCGHGAGKQGLVFETDRGEEQWVRTEAISALFKLFSSNIRCVLLNACYSSEQANAIVEHIDYVIGMQQEIRDDAAISFSRGFYLALGYNASLEEAYEIGCNAIQLEIIGSSIVRSAGSATARKAEVVDAIENTVIPEDKKPILRCRQGALQIRDWKQTPERLSQKTREELFRDIAQAMAAASPPPSSSASAEVKRASASEPPSLPRRSAPSSSQSPLTRILIGGLAVCTISGIGIYGYHQWQENQPGRSTLREAIGLAKQERWEEAIAELDRIPPNSPVANQIQSYLEEWSRQILVRARKHYEEGSVDEAVNAAKAIPMGSVIYDQIQQEMTSWQEDQQRLEKIEHDLRTANDLIGAAKIIKEIQSPGLRSQAQELYLGYADREAKQQGEIREADQQRLEQIRTVLQAANDLEGAGKLLDQIRSPEIRTQAQALVREYNKRVADIRARERARRERAERERREQERELENSTPQTPFLGSGTDGSPQPTPTPEASPGSSPSPTQEPPVQPDSKISIPSPDSVPPDSTPQ